MIKLLLISISFMTTSYSLADNSKSICGRNDDRVLSFEAKVGRLSTLEQHRGCTATMISESCAISAGHCKSVLIKAEFNTPESIAREPQPSEKEDVYLIDQSTIKSENDGPGKDWAVFKFQPNTITGKLPGSVQGYYNVSFDTVSRGSTIRITGYGIDSQDETGNFAQQTHTGELKSVGGLFNRSHLKHTADTMGGNSGSSIILEETQDIIGIHTHGGCHNFGGSNSGTLINQHPELIAAIKACLDSERQ